MAQLIPIPNYGQPALPDFSDAEAAKQWLVGFLSEYDTFRSLIKQNVDALILDARSQNPGSLLPTIGTGGAQDMLRNVPVNLASARMRMGLQLANGSTRNKVTITFQYLGVGPVIVGSGVNVTYTADLSVAGVNGLDTGTEAANTWYYVYIIVGDFGPIVSDAATNNNQPPLQRRGVRVASLLSTSATPTMPAGYNRYRRVGMVRNNATSDLYRFINAVEDDWFWWNEDTTTADFRVLSVTTSVVTFTDVACATSVPPTSRTMYLNEWITDTVGTAYLYVINKDAVNVVYAAAGAGLGIAVATDEAQGRFLVGCDASQKIQYRTNATTVDVRLDVLAYKDIR